MPLTILSASAGSGKTYRLTREFVNLCLQDEDPASAASVLAMTFTNKATAEMKSRILALLRSIADQNEKIGSDPQQDVLADILNQHGYPTLARRAKQCLRYLIRHYHGFSVSTIDSFFQKVIRQFQRELGRHHPYTVELNQYTVLLHAIDRMLEQLMTESTEYQWIVDWVSENLERDKNWNIRGQLADLGIELFSEQYRAANDGSEANPEQVSQTLREISAELDSIDGKLNGNRQAVKNLLQKLDLDLSEFSYSDKGVVGLWINEEKDLLAIKASKRVMQFDKDVNKLFPSKRNNQKVNDTMLIQLENELIPLYDELQGIIMDELPQWIAYRAVRENIRTYVALRFLQSHIEEYCTDNDIMLISSANELVATALNDANVNLLYEKSGEKYHHLLVDEFQDTSRLQWLGMKPLMENSLAEGRYSMVVGDIKQSIYRWRNSDWRLMHHTVQRDFAHFYPNSESLADNWRSAEQIVDFNNNFYDAVKLKVFSEFMKAYGDHEYVKAFGDIYSNVSQTSRADGDKHGSVLITRLSAQLPDDRKDTDSVMQAWLKAQLDRLFKQGFSCADIALLVRDNKEVRWLMEWFARWDEDVAGGQKYRAVSDKGFLLENSELVQWLISLWKYRQNPSDRSLQALTIWLRECLDGRSSEGDSIFNTPEPLQEIPEAWLNYLKQPVSTLSEWFAGLVKLAGYENTAPVYWLAFMDTVRKFELEFGNEPAMFSAWWDERRAGLGIPPDKSMDAMQVLTIHSAKGLEWPVVIVPFTTAPVEGEFKGNIYVNTGNNPLLEVLGTVPVKMNRNLEDSLFRNTYVDEYLLNIIDQINLLYVATTRPGQHLLLAARERKTGNSPYCYGDLILESMPGSMEPSGIYEDSYVSGDVMAGPYPKEEPTDDTTTLDVPVSIRRQTLRAGAWHFKPLPVEAEPDQPGSRGILVHAVLEHLKDAASLDKCLAELREAGVISNESITDIRPVIETFLNDERVKPWFDPHAEVYAEREIIEIDGKAYRPDRVVYSGGVTTVIDFKTGSGSDRHKEQLKKYMELLQKMGFPNIIGKLAYLDTMTIESLNR